MNKNDLEEKILSELSGIPPLSRPTMRNAEQYYLNALKDGSANQKFTDAYLRVISHGVKTTPQPEYIGDLAAFYSINSELASFDNIIKALKIGGFAEFNNFRKRLRRNFSFMKEEYTKLNKKVKADLNLNEIIKPYIPVTIRNTPIAGICYQIATEYIKGD